MSEPKKIELSLDLCSVDHAWVSAYLEAGLIRRWRMRHSRKMNLIYSHEYVYVGRPYRRGGLKVWFAALQSEDRIEMKLGQRDRYRKKAR